MWFLDDSSTRLNPISGFVGDVINVRERAQTPLVVSRAILCRLYETTAGPLSNPYPFGKIFGACVSCFVRDHP